MQKKKKKKRERERERERSTVQKQEVKINLYNLNFLRKKGGKTNTSELKKRGKQGTKI